MAAKSDLETLDITTFEIKAGNKTGIYNSSGGSSLVEGNFPPCGNATVGCPRREVVDEFCPYVRTRVFGKSDRRTTTRVEHRQRPLEPRVNLRTALSPDSEIVGRI